MLQKLSAHITQHLSFLTGKKLLIAISGGIDSVVLTHALHQLDFSIGLAHCNFTLRDRESDLDELFVEDFGKQLRCKIHTTRFNTSNFAEANHLSIQMAARKLRYDWFGELLSKHSYDYLLTAHHADDNLETFLINLTRGTGLEGLTGIPMINEKIVRPLLPFSREEIVTYATTHDLAWREDASNQETKYIRNKIRHHVVPLLKELNPSLLSVFQKTTTHLQDAHTIVVDQIEELLQNGAVKHTTIGMQLDISKFTDLSNPKAYLYHVLKTYGFTEWDNIVDLLTAQSGKQVFSNTHRLLKNRDFLLLTTIDSAKNNTSTEYFYINEELFSITKPIHLISERETEQTTTLPEHITVDKDLLKFPLILRKWENGDYFYPSGMRGKKKLSKYFKDEKLSLLDKENIWLLCSAENEIIWVVGKRQDRRFIPKKTSPNILKISYLS